MFRRPARSRKLARHPSFVRAGAIALPALAFSFATDAAAKPTEAAPGGTQLHWVPCGELYPGAECAVASVPLDYDAPQDDSVGIQLARFRGANAEASLFINPGGPGASGVDVVLGFGPYLAELLGGRFDVVGFDPRGVGSSEPLYCWANDEDLIQFFGEQLVAFPASSERERPFFDTWSGIFEYCGGQRIREHMGTADVARDLERLRQAVGDDQLHYLGFSYGSFLGVTYANLFPDRVGALVLDGVVDPLLWSSGMQITSHRESTQRELEEFLRLCDEAGSACALAGGGGARARFELIVGALEQAPLVLPDGSVYPYESLVADTIDGMYDPESDWAGPASLSALLAALYDGVFGLPGAPQRVTDVLAAMAERQAPTLPPFAPHSNALDSRLANMCSDAEYPATFDDFSSVAAFAEHGSIFGRFWWSLYAASCSSWPLGEDRYAGPWTAETAAPVLVVGNHFDGITDYAGAESAAALLPSSRLLGYAGWGHGAFTRSACITEHVTRYLLDGTLPPEGTLCPANPSPFLAPETALTADPALPLRRPRLYPSRTLPSWPTTAGP